jgi:hypothetical protein
MATSTVPVVNDLIICTGNPTAQGQPAEGGIYIVVAVVTGGFAVQKADGNSPQSAMQSTSGPYVMPQNRIISVIHAD